MANGWKPGDICYWCNRLNGLIVLGWGMIEGIYDGYAYVDYLVPRERRRVNGIPMDQFETETEYHPLPKKWSYDTEMFKLTWDPVPDMSGIKVEDPATIINAVRSGLLVRKSEVFDGSIETEITGPRGREVYRVVKKWPSGITRGFSPFGATVMLEKLFRNCEEAKKKVEAEKAEEIRVANLSDEEANDEEYPKYLSWHFDEETVSLMMAALHRLPNYGDVEIKVTDVFSGDGQYQVFYRYFSPANPVRPLPVHTKGRETKAQRMKRLCMMEEKARKEFFQKWTPLAWA